MYYYVGLGFIKVVDAAEEGKEREVSLTSS